MNKAVGLIGAAGVGAGLMYMLDPDRGKRRRAEVRNKARHFSHVATDCAGKTQRDLRNHIRGVVSEMKSFVQSEPVSDDVLEARVRSKMGRVVSHPHAIKVKAEEGLIILSGPILTAEVIPLVDAVTTVPGVKNIENLLDLHETPEEVPALQGGKGRTGECFGPFKSIWSPTTRLLAGVAGGALTIYAGKRRGALGAFLGSMGLCMATRAVTNFELPQFGRKDKGIVPDEEVAIDAPIDVAGKAETIVHSQIA